MKRKIWYVSLLCGFIVMCATGFIYWQLLELGKGIRTMPTNKAEEVMVSSLSGQVLAPSVEGNELSKNENKPLLDLYRADPLLIHQRYLQVLTWVNASKIAAAITTYPQDNRMMDSASLTNVPIEERLDGWRQPYCVLIGTDKVAFLSSAGSGAMDCEGLHVFAQHVITLSSDSRLTKEGKFLITVQPKNSTLPSR